jgi:putative ABC transport system permease protein
MEAIINDVKHAVRLFRESTLFTAMAIAALTLGIGVNVAVFSVVNAVLLKPVPFAEPDRLVTLMISSRRAPLIAAASPAQFVYWWGLPGVFESIAASTSISFNYAGGDAPERLAAARVSEEYFRVLRAPLVVGRTFTPDEDRPGGGNVAVLSHAFWMRSFGADPSVVGRTVALDGSSYTVVGVAGRQLDLREYGSPQVWVPLQTNPSTTDRPYIYQVIGRLAPGVTLAQAQERLEASVAAFRERFPDVLGPRAGFSAVPMQAAAVGASARTTLLLLCGAVVCVLLIACANVANLLLVRATGRRREIAIRSALGASRARVVRQLLVESGLLSLAGGALGLVGGYAGMRALLAVNTAGLPRVGEAGSLAALDWRIVLFTGALSLLTTLLFGLAPALSGSRVDLVSVVRSGSRASGDGRQSALRSTLVVVEIALAVVLVTGAALFIRASLALSQVDAGFDSRNLLTVHTSLSGARFATTASVEDVVRVGRERLGAIPGVADVAATSCVPMQPCWGMPFNVVGRDDAGLYTGSNSVVFSSPGYFEILGIPVLRGRLFDDGDGSGAAPVAIINEALARRHWPDGVDPLAARMVIGGGAANMREYADEPARQVIGIVADVRTTDLASDPAPVMYVPHAQLADPLSALITSSLPTVWLVRTQGDPAALAKTIQDELQRATGLAVTDVRTMEQVVSSSVSRQRLHALLMTVFGAAALLLATIGIYSVVAYSAQQRTHELGIRSALGAAPRELGAIVLRHGLVLIAAGVGAGLLVAAVAANLLASFLYGVEPHDGTVFAGVTVALSAVALAAVWSVAQRASRVDPLTSLRNE